MIRTIDLTPNLSAKASPKSLTLFHDHGGRANLNPDQVNTLVEYLSIERPQGVLALGELVVIQAADWTILGITGNISSVAILQPSEAERTREAFRDWLINFHKPATM